MLTRRLAVLFTFLLCCLAVPRTWAQTNATATLTGTLLTEQGTPLPGASVVALHLPTGIRRMAATDAQGHFSIDVLLPGGPYVLQISQAGFRSQVVSNMFLQASQPVNLNFTLVLDVVSVGTRRADRSATDATGPVDIVDLRELVGTTASADLTQVLHYTVPSFNSTRQTTADGADHVDPSSLRGLAPDQLLVLVNGKRQHTTALLNLLGNRGVGSVGYDLNAFSVNALDRVEILRDGAAAQYGSDAIAGVINLNLKSDDYGGNVLVGTGLHGAGDGLTTTLSLNKGLKLGAKGFLNLTGEADYRGATSRKYSRDLNSWPVFSGDQAREDSFLRAHGKTYADYTQRNGNARIQNYRAVVNAGLKLSDRARLYAFGTFNQRLGNSATLWRLPSQAELLDEVHFPLGYQPEINTHILDVSGTAGAVLGLPGGWSLDLSNTAGTNRMHYQVSNTLNASLGAASPTSFDAGRLQFSQDVSNATFSRLFPKALAGTNVAFGAELRAEDYEIVAGEAASYTYYQQGKPGAGAGSQGFLGYADLAAGNHQRTSYAGFADVEADVVKHWTLNGALRYEHYSSFGTALIFKLATRVQLGRQLVLRAGYNNGFRAPSLQQEEFRQLTVLPTATGDVRYSGIFNNRSSVAQAAGIPGLQAETSHNFSAGLVLTPAEGLTFSADAYRIDIDNRILLSGAFERDAVRAPQLTAALTALNADRAQFFVNAASTRTEGLDLVASYARRLGRGEARLRLAGNLARHHIRAVEVPAALAYVNQDTNLGNDYLDQRQLSQLATGTPNAKLHAELGYTQGKLSGLVRATYFGQVAYYDYNYEGLPEGSFYLVFSPKTVTDLQLTFRPTKALAFTAGANNLFNIRPDTKLQAARNGHAPDGFASIDAFNSYFKATYGYDSYLPYDRDIVPYEPVQMGFNGAFFYLKAAYTLGL